MVVNEKRRNMLRLLKASAHLDKLIVTVRTSYFRGPDELWSLFLDESDSSTYWGQLAKHMPHGEVSHGASAIVLREMSSLQIETYIQKLAEIPNPREKEVQELKARGAQTASLVNVMELVLLCASPGTVLEVVYAHCTEGQIERLLNMLGAAPDSTEPGLWATTLAFDSYLQAPQ